MNAQASITAEFADLFVKESINPYRSCIQGLANEPITVLALLRRAHAFLRDDPDFAGLGDYSRRIIVERLASGRPRVSIIQGSADHPAHLFDHEHMLRASGGTASCPWRCTGARRFRGRFSLKGIRADCDETLKNEATAVTSRNPKGERPWFYRHLG
ncbi:MAG: hypothetical protein LBR95_00770 [Azoarcus sp.]|nr:hypothetical protein [Azoarcus sp.]